jgi:hypothetical protein
VITDVGHPFDLAVHKALASRAPQVCRLAYYDNPEPYVPGGYSAVAAEVMQAAQGILFANANLVETSLFQAPGKRVDLGTRTKVGIGYYPIKQAENIANRRKAEHFSARRELLHKRGLTDRGQRVLGYFGGNNEEYRSKALPSFLALLEKGMMQADLTNLVIVFQQHPGAKATNLDRNLVEEWISKQKQMLQAPKIILSNFESDYVQIAADGAFYYQSSMAPQFVLAGIPTIQIGHETYEDILVRNQLIQSITSVAQLISFIVDLSHEKKEIPREVILEKLGVKTDWLEILEKAIKQFSASS